MRMLRFFAAPLAGLAALGAAQTAYAEGGHNSVSPMLSTATLAPVPASFSTLHRDRHGITYHIHTQISETTEPAQLRLVIFNHPENCTAGAPGIALCGSEDVANPATGALMLPRSQHRRRRSPALRP